MEKDINTGVFIFRTVDLTVCGKAWLTASTALSGHNAVFVSVGLIGEKNQVILELIFYNGSYNKI